MTFGRFHPHAVRSSSARGRSEIDAGAYDRAMDRDPTFLLLGEPLSLDLVNTRASRDGIDMDLLTGPIALRAWLTTQSERVTWSDACTREDVIAVRTLRDAIARLLASLGAHTAPKAEIATLNTALRDFRGPELMWSHGEFEISTPNRSDRFAGVLHVIAADAVRLVTGPSAKQIRTCAHPQCSVVFVADNPRRLWCSAASCGNRARVARNYARRTQASA